MTDRLAEIRARHSEIPQEPLPLDIPDAGSRATDARIEKSVGQAICTWHTDRGNDKTTGLIRAREGLVFREHTKRVGRTTVRCPGSGQAPIEEEGN